jgi:hypothetical protein
MISKEDVKAGATLYWYAAVALGIIVAVATTLYAMKPVWLGFEREAVKASHQYVESSETGMLNWIEAYADANTKISEYRLRSDADTKPVQTLIANLESQKAVLYRRVKTRAARVGKDNLSDEVTLFLASQGPGN